jgi:osmotically-inducible protein OsmY
VRATLAFLVGFAAGALGAIRWLERQIQAGPNGEALSDQEVAADIRGEWRRLGLLADDVKVTVVEGITHLQGSTDSVTADTLRATARRMPGVEEVRDDVTRVG